MAEEIDVLSFRTSKYTVFGVDVNPLSKNSSAFPLIREQLSAKPKPGSGLRFCDSRAAAPRSFDNTTVASDRESQIASLTPVSSLGGSIKDDESIAAANENGIAMAFTGISSFQTLA